MWSPTARVTAATMGLIILIFILEIAEQAMMADSDTSKSTLRAIAVLRLVSVVSILGMFIYITKIVFVDALKGLGYKDLLKRLLSIQAVKDRYDTYKSEEKLFTGVDESLLTDSAKD